MVTLWRQSIGFLVLLAVNCLFVHVWAAPSEPSVRLSTSEQSVFVGDSIIIELESVHIDSPLDTSPLLQSADLLRETVGTRIIVINGQVVEMKLRRMEFLAAQEGSIVFGPIVGTSANGMVTSNAITVTVKPLTKTQWQPSADDLHIEVSLSTHNAEGPLPLTSGHDKPISHQPFIGQQIIANITLKHKHPIADEQVSLPDFKGFDVLEQFVERRTLDEPKEGSSWRITAWRYHLFAQRSGELTIDPVLWSGTVTRSRTQRATFERQSLAQTLAIKPAQNTSHWWLPAREVTLEDHWSKDPRELTAGDEIIRTITLNAQDVLSNHLPDIVPPESRALTTTPIRQFRSQKLLNGRITATAVFEFRMVAQSPIPVFLDTVRVPWFDIQAMSHKESIIPARRINVGLPDRDDLLMSIALEGSWLDRLNLRIASHTPRWFPERIVFVLLLLVALGFGLLEWFYWREERRKDRLKQPSSVLPTL